VPEGRVSVIGGCFIFRFFVSFVTWTNNPEAILPIPASRFLDAIFGAASQFEVPSAVVGRSRSSHRPPSQSTPRSSRVFDQIGSIQSWTKEQYLKAIHKHASFKYLFMRHPLMTRCCVFTYVSFVQIRDVPVHPSLTTRWGNNYDGELAFLLTASGGARNVVVAITAAILGLAPACGF